MSALSTPQLAALVKKHFGDLGPQVVADMTATFLAESGGRTDAHNPTNDNGTQDYGLAQINSMHGYDTNRLLSDPDYNLQAARAIYDQQGIGAWSAWNAGKALDYWDDAAAAVTNTPQTKSSRLGATIGKQGSSDMVSQAASPLNVNTGADLTKLYYWVLQQQQALATDPSQVTGYYPSQLSGGAAGSYSPTLQRQQYDQTYQAQRDDASRNYALDMQRFGLDYANTAFNQSITSANQQLAQRALEVQRSGPEDWLKYNYVINNRTPPVENTVKGDYNGIPNTVNGSAPPPAPNGSALALGSGNNGSVGAGLLGSGNGDGGQAPTWNASGNLEGYKQSIAQGQSLGQQNQAYNTGGPTPTATASPSMSGGTATPQPGPSAADNAQTVAAFNNMPKLAFGGESAPMQGDVMMPGEDEFSEVPPAPGGGFIEWLHKLYEADMSARGGSVGPGGGMHAAVVGDPQNPSQQPDANPELVTSPAPFNVTPLNAMPAGARGATEQLPHKATGGLVFGMNEAMDAPFVQKEMNGGAAFNQRGEDLGAYGKSPLNYTNYQQLLPSEQAMTRGYIDTPTSMGGLAGYSPDELERARRSQFSGINFGPTGYAAG